MSTARFTCKCVKRCGGPDGPGKQVAYSTLKKHQKAENTAFSLSGAPDAQPEASSHGNLDDEDINMDLDDDAMDLDDNVCV